MASASRSFTRVLRSTPTASSTLRIPTARSSRLIFQQQVRRGYSSEAPKQAGSRNALLYGGIATAVFGGAGYFALGQQDSVNAVKAFTPSKEHYQEVYDAIAKRLVDEDQYDDGSYGPVLLRLAWHCSGTYDKATGTGGSHGATMRFAPESDHGANAGLAAARNFLEPIKAQFPWLTYSDLWTLAGVAAIQEMGGPNVPWRPGRADRDVSFCTPDGRLPDASQGQDHLRAIFYRMGFNDQEIVALSGAHALGRCHTDRSGFEGPWTFSPITLTNDYYKLLLSEKWNVRSWKGPKQFQDKGSKSLMMLPTDMALIKDKSFRPWVEKYAKDEGAFFADFANVVMTLFELGVPFESSEKDRLVLKRTE
ncbi:Cytochrome c peroxidase, mitochondrial [Acrodontium crateriforme]|uniref:Peroxidase n=1 Tax=Acrodontium crateriforme TaxID=150365 RepID=A0AAQ3M6Y2_9PEZI|nr:Cytochrome c peroxidase, mitochondrial [Acrodontium crateriforme]